MLRFISNLLIVAWFSLLTAAGITMFSSPDWVAKSAELAAPGDSAPNLLERMEQGLFKRSPVTITEAEINRLLATSLVSKNIHAWLPKFNRAEMSLRPGGFEARVLWKSENGHPLTASLDFKVERKGNTFVIEPTSGSYGRLKLPRGFFGPVLPVFNGIASVLKPEIDMAFQMNHIRFETDKIQLDPRLEPVK